MPADRWDSEDFKLDVKETLGGRLVLADAPAEHYEWSGPKGQRVRSEKSDGLIFTVSCFERGFKLAAIVVQDAALVAASFVPGQPVSFEGLTGKLSGGYKMRDGAVRPVAAEYEAVAVRQTAKAAG